MSEMRRLDEYCRAVAYRRHRWHEAADHFRALLVRYAAQQKANFNPAQPRVPAGSPDGGQWSAGGGKPAGTDAGRILSDATPDNEAVPGARYAQNIPPGERLLNAHIIAEHVAKTDEELIARIRATRFPGLFQTWGMYRNGSFSSLESARDFVAQTLRMNAAEVDLVSRGANQDAFLIHRFGFVTGREAILDVSSGTIRVRNAYEVGVFIIHDPHVDVGYRIGTAYPRNYNPFTGR